MAQAKRRQAAQLIAEAQVLEGAAAQLEGLQSDGGNRTMVTVGTPATVEGQQRHRVRLSQANARVTGFYAAMQAAGLTMGSIAERLGVSRAAVSWWHSGKNRIPPEAAAKIEQWTGFPASAWPSIQKPRKS